MSRRRRSFRLRTPAEPEPFRADEPDGLWKWRGEVWTPSTARKATECARTGATIAPGDSVWRPISNSDARFYRVKSWPEPGQ